MRMLLLVAGALMALPAATFAQDTSGGVVRVEKPVTGEQVYGAVCQACHMADAKGAVGAGTIPALASNPKLAGAAYPIMVVARGQGAMPGFAGMLSNAQMAEAVTYVRTHFGNSYAKPVTEADVAKLAKPPAAGGH
ncbi:MAG: cytochrome c [Proteobacteria bacterium]|nr:cytochrome c [Pseudomonadota bacterium]